MPELARLAAEADVLITVLAGPGEVRELMLGTGGAAAALRRGTTWIDMTSNSPAAVTEIRDGLLDRGVQVLDAPAGRGVAAARQGTLQLLVGGEAEVVARHRDLLEILGRPNHGVCERRSSASTGQDGSRNIKGRSSMNKAQLARALGR